MKVCLFRISTIENKSYKKPNLEAEKYSILQNLLHTYLGLLLQTFFTEAVLTNTDCVTKALSSSFSMLYMSMSLMEELCVRPV